MVQLMNREKAIVIDVCSPEEFAQGHVIGAKNLPLGQTGRQAGPSWSRANRPKW
jgi:rhodanese-related sulfurtransferase